MSNVGFLAACYPGLALQGFAHFLPFQIEKSKA